MYILIVDDEKIILDLTSIILKNRGNKVFTASNYADAISVMKREAFDIVLTDMNIGKADCRILIDFANSQEGKPSILIFALKKSEEIAREMLKSGAYDYILKPFNNQDLTERVNRAYTEKKLNDELTKLRKQLESVSARSITRSIEFEPEYYQAGLSILTYFNTVVNQKYPDMKVKIKIEQEDKLVRMVIETPEGEKERIEKTLEQYGLIVKGDISPETLFSNPFEVMSLRNKLELTALELRQAQELYRICESKNVERINALEDQVKRLQHIVADGLRGANKNADLLFKMFEIYMADSKIEKDLEIILSKLEGGITLSDEAEIKKLLTKLNKTNPNLLYDLRDFVMGSVAGVSGNYLYKWINSLIGGYP